MRVAGLINRDKIFRRYLKAQTALVAAALLWCAAACAAPAPTLPDYSYGPHERNVLDFWRAESATPAPVVIYIHGGGFYLGSKGNVNGADIETCLKNGVSVASINYPYYADVPLQGIIRDNIARAVQFLRYKAGELNIDKDRIAVYGQSAGAGSSLWLAFHDDLADPASQDPVLRESSRVRAAGAIDTQATYDFLRWPEIFKQIIDGRAMNGWMLVMKQVILDMYHVKQEKDLKSPENAAMRRDLDMLALMDASDPPVIMQTFESRLRSSDVLHHIAHPMTVLENCEKTGVACTLIRDETPEEQRIRVVEFLIRRLKQD